MFIEEGSKVRTFTNCNDAIGEIFVYGDSLDECNQKINEITNEINIEIAEYEHIKKNSQVSR